MVFCMVRYLSSHKKGQWFLISAVIVTGIFLVISMLFTNYLKVDVTEVPLKNVDYNFNDIKYNLYKIDGFYGDACTNLQIAVNYYTSFATNEMSKKGYLMDIMPSYQPAPSCRLTKPVPLISLISERMSVWEGERPVIE